MNFHLDLYMKSRYIEMPRKIACTVFGELEYRVDPEMPVGLFEVRAVSSDELMAEMEYDPASDHPEITRDIARKFR